MKFILKEENDQLSINMTVEEAELFRTFLTECITSGLDNEWKKYATHMDDSLASSGIN